jgi:basic membrane protein A
MVGITGLAGCLGGGGGDEGGGQTTTSGETWKIAIVYAVGGLGDKGFLGAEQTIVSRVEEELGIEPQWAEPTSNDEYETFHKRFARSSDPDYDLILGLTFSQLTAVSNAAQEFPDQRWTIIDTVVEDRDNVGSVRFKEHEGCYLAGWLAGSIASEGWSAGGVEAPGNGVVGFVGGQRIPVIERFHAGYKAGAEAVGDIEVLSAYAGDFTSPSKGRSAAKSMFDNGADIVFHAAGSTGTGIFRAGQDAGRPTIGVDKDQSKTLPEYEDVIVASMLKRMAPAVFSSIEAVINGNYDGTSTRVLGLEEKAHAITYGQTLGSEVPQSIKDEVGQKRQAIIDGDITPPKTLDE